MNDIPNSGSRWEPGPDEQVTQRLSAPSGPIVPGLVAEPATPVGGPRRFGRRLAAVAVVAAATLAGGAVGMAVAGNRTSQVSDTTQVGTTQDGTSPSGTAPDGAYDQQLPPGAPPDFHDGDGFGHHGFDDDH